MLFYNMVEKDGTWPRPLATVIVALIPKEGAQCEGDLRPRYSPQFTVCGCVYANHTRQNGRIPFTAPASLRLLIMPGAHGSSRN